MLFNFNTTLFTNSKLKEEKSKEEQKAALIKIETKLASVTMVSIFYLIYNNKGSQRSWSLLCI